MDHDFWQHIEDKPQSDPCAEFVRGVRETIDFVFFVTSVVTSADEVQLIAAKALAETARPDEADEHQKRLEDAEQSKPTTEQLRRFRQVIFQILITRSVDQYLTFISGLLSNIFRERPETLRSGEQVKLDFVLRHESMDELIDALAERRVDRLAYRGLRELAIDLKDTLGFVLFEQEDDLERAERIVENRNLIVHNQATVNAKYLRKVTNAASAVGEKLDFDLAEVLDDIEFLSRCAIRTDDLACVKWQLAQNPWQHEMRR